jgi:dCTP diphosphatase
MQSILMNDEILAIQSRLRAFSYDRDWEQFHSPKNLATALSIEASEILEHFQWLNDEQSRNLSAEKRDLIAEEIADVMLYLLQLADKLGIDTIAAANRKIEINASKYPIEKSRGNSDKYSDL